MRILRPIAISNWRYALGEICLIVIGVSLALAATSWYDGRTERRNETLLLRQLRATLSDDLLVLNDTRDRTRHRKREILTLLDHLESDQPYSPDLGLKFQALFGWRTVRITKAPFEALRAEGYRAISNPALRRRLISFYEDHYPKLEYNSYLDRDLAIDRIQPYFFENFIVRIAASDDVDGGSQEWIPHDYEKIRVDSYVANLCRFRADILDRFLLRDLDVATVSVRGILDELDRELADSE